jgi:NhaP-type Na+/H+ or K+/H+ antiporter
MTPDLVYTLVGGALLLAVVLPAALHRQAVSAPMVLLGVGALMGLLPLGDEVSLSPVDHLAFVEHLTEFTVIIALMGVGLALDRPLRLSRLRGWSSWGGTWRMLGIAMPLCIGGVWLLGWGVLGLAPAAALLLGAALAPTDPVLASDVQVGGPTALEDDAEEHGGIDEDDDVRFALTSEAGLNDGLAFPFVLAAVALAGSSDVGSWVVGWFAWDVVGRVVVGVAVGVVTGWLLARIAFRAPAPSLRLAETGEPLLALAAVLLSYGVAEIAHAYGFLAVFACAMTMRSAERGHEYHQHMHAMVERLERLLTLVVLLLLGMSLTNGLLEHLTWSGVVIGVLLLLVVRPLSGAVALLPWRPEGDGFDTRERLAVAFFGVRGVGSLFYLAFATSHADFGDHDALWATVGFTITASVLLHGITATPWLRRLDLRRTS